MSAPLTNCDCPCPDPVITEIPGSPGENGTNGADGADGHNAFTVLTDFLEIPNIGSGFIASVGDSTFAAIGQILWVSDGTHGGTFSVAAVPTTHSLDLTFLGYPNDSAPGDNINSGAKVTPAGIITPLASPLPNAITDNSTLSATNAIELGIGVTTLSFFITATAIANGDLLTNYVPGYAFKILKFDARCAAPVTTGSKAANLNLEIDSTNLTGGIVALAGTYAQGAAQAGTAVTADNEGTATQSISIEASGVTAFVEGAFWLIVEIQSLDTARAIVTLTERVNDLITALT